MSSQKNCHSRARILLAFLLLVVAGVAVTIDGDPVDAQLGAFEIDGNVTDEGAGDWAAPAGADLFSCWDGSEGFGGANTTSFAGGGKLDDDFPGAGWNDGNVPPKSDLQNAAVCFYVDANGDLLIYGALDRLSVNGSLNVGFWMLKDPEFAVNADGTFSGEHKDGDLAVVTNIQNGTFTTSVYEWAGGALGTTPVASSTCSPTGSVCAQESTTNQTTTLGPFENFNGGSNYEPGSFVEFGMNVTEVLGYTPCVSAMLAFSLAGNSLNSAAKDFIELGGGLDTCEIDVTKTPLNTIAEEEIGEFTFEIEVDNTESIAPFTVDSVVDAPYGDVTTAGATLLANVTITEPLSCPVPFVVPAGQTETCTFTITIEDDLIEGADMRDPYPDTITVSGEFPCERPDEASDDAVVYMVDHKPQIGITKTPDPTALPEPGGDVTFTFTVENLDTRLPADGGEAVTLTALTDSVFGDLNGQGTCAVPQVILAASSYTCTVTVPILGDAGFIHTNTVTGTAEDNEGNTTTDSADAVVTITDALPAIGIVKTADPVTIDEPGGDVAFTFVVTNLSAAEAVTVTSLTDSVFGDLNGQGTCVTPTVIAASGVYSCSVTVPLVGEAGDVHMNTATVVGQDDDGNTTMADDDAEVEFLDVPSAISVVKTADPVVVPEPGADVDFTIVITNDSVVDSITVSSVVDDVFGDVSDECEPALPATILPGRSITCTFTEFVGTNAGDQHVNIATATATDDDGNELMGSDDATVDVTDVPASIETTKVAGVGSVPEPGDDVEFVVTTVNTSTVDTVTINTVVDSIFGDVSASCFPVLPAVLPPGESTVCSFTGFVDANVADPHVNTATATGVDDDGNPVEDADDATVDITDVPSSIELEKSSLPGAIPEPGGDVLFTFVVTNTSLVDDVTLLTLIDSEFGDLNGQGDCVMPQPPLAPGAQYTCQATFPIAGNAGEIHMNTATVTAVDDDDNPLTDSDDASVPFTDLPSSISVDKQASTTSVAEPGADVDFTIVVTNTSEVDDVTINTVTDTIFGDVSATCLPALPTTLAPDEQVECTFTEFVAGNAGETHLNVATAAGVDDDGNPVEGDDDAEVGFDDVPSSFEILKAADVSSIVEPGQDVTFTFTITNTSPADEITVTALTDDVLGNLNGQGDCVVPLTLAVGGVSECSVTTFIAGQGGDTHMNVVTATAVDDDDEPLEEQDDLMLPVDDLPPSIQVDKSASDVQIPEPGGPVTFTIVVTNTSPADDVTLTSLVDDIYGDLNGQGDCVTPTTIVLGGSYTCAFTVDVLSNVGMTTETDVVDAVAEDEEGNVAEGTDDAVVYIDDVPPSISVDKVAAAAMVDPGEVVTFTIEVTNTSPADAVTLTDLVDSIHGDLDGQGTCILPVVVPISGSFVCSFDAAAVGGAGETETNVATATGTDNEGNVVDGDDDESVLLTNPPQPKTPYADLILTKTVRADSILLDTSTTFDLVVLNQGPDTATGVTLVDTMPTGLTIVDAVPQAGSCTVSGQVISCTLSDIPVGESTTVAVTVTGSSVGVFENAAITASDIEDPGDEENEATATVTVFGHDLPDTGRGVSSILLQAALILLCGALFYSWARRGRGLAHTDL